MNITIKVNLDNAAFEDNQAELAEILAQQIPNSLQPGYPVILKDSNGNTVGSYEVQE